MKRHLLLTLLTFSLAACATPVTSPDQLNMEEGKGFDKESFSTHEYLKQHQECFSITQRISPNNKFSPKDAYLGCMTTRGYKYVNLPKEKLQERERIMAEYIKAHTPTKSNYYHKNNFSDASYVQDMKQCISNSETIMRTPNAPFFSTSLIGLIAVQSISAMEKTSERDNKRQAYILNCMFDNGYVLRELSQEERQRRINLIK